MTSCAQHLQRATALDILDFLHIAAFEYLTKQLFNVREELLLDRETCGRLLAFLHCNSLIDCSKKLQRQSPEQQRVYSPFPNRAPRSLRIHLFVQPSAHHAESSSTRDTHIFAGTRHNQPRKKPSAILVSHLNSILDGAQAEPILAALKPRLLDDINDPRLALRAYLVVSPYIVITHYRKIPYKQFRVYTGATASPP